MDDLGKAGEIDYSIEVGRAYSFVFLAVTPIVVILALMYIGFWGRETFFTGLRQFTSLPSLIPVVILGVPLHEFLHALGWSVSGRIPIREVKFGVLWKILTPYAHLEKPIESSVYKIGALSPFLIMGVFPSMLGLIIGHAWILDFGLMFILAAGGDLLVVWILRKVTNDVLVIDHPTRVGCIVLEGTAKESH